MKSYNWPNKKKFAFSIFDDTDNARTEDVAAIYDFLTDLGIKTTKSVWINAPSYEPRIGGVTCADLEYRALCQRLQKKGVEIAFHNASSSSSTRQDTLLALRRFKEYFGHYPKSFANHARNEENIYWGENRISGIRKTLFKSKLDNLIDFKGHIADSDFYWSDFAKKHITYTRNFTFQDIDTGKCDRFTPYHDPQKPDVNFWFSSSDGYNLEQFLRLVTGKNLNTLETNGGYSIVYTHFCSFAKNGIVDPRFKGIMQELATRNGWFAPVSEILDHLRTTFGDKTLRNRQRMQLEWRWIMDQMRKRLWKS